MSKKAVHVPKVMIVRRAMYQPSTIFTTDISLIDRDDNIDNDMPDKSLTDELNVIAAVYYWQTIDKDTWMKQYSRVEKTDWERMKRKGEMSSTCLPSTRIVARNA